MSFSFFQKNKSEPFQNNEKKETSSQQSSFTDKCESADEITQLQSSVDNSSKAQEITQLQEKVDNSTGMPDDLKKGVENLSGHDMSDVKVHYNSDKPAQLQAHAYAQGTDIHIAPGQEKHLPHEAWHVAQQKQGRVQPTKQMKSKVNINDDQALEKEADVMGQKANLVGKSAEKVSEVTLAQQNGESVLQGKFSQDDLHQFSTTQPIQLEKSSEASDKTKRNVGDEEMKLFKDAIKGKEDKPLDLEQIQKDTGLTLQQITTAKARMFGELQVADKEGKNAFKIRQANSFDKWFVEKLTPENHEKVRQAREQIPTPEQIFTQEAINKHLEKFANGAHAFIDADTSAKIKGDIQTPHFKGWGIDYNFVAPLGEAEKLHSQASKENGIINLEHGCGINNYNWSRSDWNPKKEMVRWTIPKPQSFKLENNDTFLSMATGKETGALVNEWVAGGFTLGGMPEAVIKAIPREQLLKALADGKIKSETVVYNKTPDNIGEKGPGTLPNTSEHYKKPFRSRG